MLDMTADGALSVPLQHLTGFLLRRAYVVCREHAEACIGEDTTVREVPVLTLVRDDEPISQRRLGELLGLNRTTTSKLVDALELKGWVVRDRDARDRRSYALRLTLQGRESLAALHHSLEGGEARLMRSLTSAEHERLAAELRALLLDDPTTSIAGLGSRCGYLIARAHRKMFRQASDALAPLGLAPRDFGMLSALSAAQPCSQQRLAAILGISPPAVLAFVDELEAAGIVSRRRNAVDRRAYELTLTAEGIAKLAACRRVVLEIQASVVLALGQEGDEDLRRLLNKIIGSAAHGERPAMSHPFPDRRTTVETRVARSS